MHLTRLLKELIFLNLSNFALTDIPNIIAGDCNFIVDPLIDYSGPSVNHWNALQGSTVMNQICDTFKLVDVYPTVYPKRPSYTCVTQQTFSRLDRIYVTNSLSHLITSTWYAPVAYSDHFIVGCNIVERQREYGNGLWKCNVSILNDIDVIGDIKMLSKMQ